MTGLFDRLAPRRSGVAWITHHLPVDTGVVRAGLLPGRFAGGGEMTTAAMLASTPMPVTVFSPDRWVEALSADRIIVGGTDFLSDEAMVALAARCPMVWVHHKQTPTPGRKALLEAASPLVCMSDLHAAAELSWLDRDSAEVCSGWLDPGEVPEGARRRSGALWAARNHPQKGAAEARVWARGEGVHLTEVTDAPRSFVLEQMARHETFVFLPTELDACPRTVIEAGLAGCRLVVNDNVGRVPVWDQGRAAISEHLQAQPGRFWGWV